MPDVVYDHLPTLLMRGEIDFEEDPLFLLLADNNYKPHRGHKTVSQVRGGEIVAQGYTAGGKQLQNVQVINGALHADPVVWTRSTIRARHAVLYAQGSGLLICCSDFGGEQESKPNGVFVADIPAQGLLQLTSGPAAGADHERKP